MVVLRLALVAALARVDAGPAAGAGSWWAYHALEEAVERATVGHSWSYCWCAPGPCIGRPLHHCGRPTLLGIVPWPATRALTRGLRAASVWLTARKTRARQVVDSDEPLGDAWADAAFVAAGAAMETGFTADEQRQLDLRTRALMAEAEDFAGLTGHPLLRDQGKGKGRSKRRTS